MKKKDIKRLLIIGIFLNTMMGVANASTSVRLVPVAFGCAIDDGLDGSYDRIFSDELRVGRVPHYYYGPYEIRGAIEFNISSIPAGATIENATLDLFWYSGSNLTPSTNLYGYIGNGVFNSSDVFKTGNLLSTDLPGLRNVNVTPFVQNLVNRPYQYAGFLGVETKDDAIRNYGYYLYLNINYVPEPATLLFLGFGGLILLRKK